MNPRYYRYYTYIRPIVKNKAVQNYSFLIFSVITSVIFMVFAVQPTLRTIIGLQRSITEQKQLLDELKTKVSNLEMGKKNYENLLPKTKNRLNELLPDTIAVSSLIQDLESLAEENQASISALQFQPINLPQQDKTLSKNPTVSSFDFILNLQAPYPNLLKYLAELRRSQRLTQIDSINFIKNQDGDLVLTINAKAYYINN